MCIFRVIWHLHEAYLVSFSEWYDEVSTAKRRLQGVSGNLIIVSAAVVFSAIYYNIPPLLLFIIPPVAGATIFLTTASDMN
jgi:hypothetical protein